MSQKEEGRPDLNRREKHGLEIMMACASEMHKCTPVLKERLTMKDKRGFAYYRMALGLLDKALGLVYDVTPTRQLRQIYAVCQSGAMQKPQNQKVFIVHVHDNEAKAEMARILEKLGFEAIILHEQPNAGRTIIEKIAAYSDVAFAVVLYTECDLGRDKNIPVNEEKYRARQNVVFEHGYLIGKLGRKKVSAFVKGDVETPGDISGVVYTAMDKAGAWKQELVKEMNAVGLNVDFHKLL